MKNEAIPFRFNLTNLLNKARRKVGSSIGDITLNLPFVSIAISPKDLERKVAREVVIRLKDRRVLSASECCDNCIDNALKSLQEIRVVLVDKQVELSDIQDGSAYLLLDAMTLGIRQFLTFEQRLNSDAASRSHAPTQGFYRPHDIRQAYFEALELLRGHLSRCLGQMALIAGMSLPTEDMIAKYQGPWMIEAYEPLVIDDKSSGDSPDA
ncbi:MAG: hypothetical protein JNK21_06120 [Rhodospirillaceae bacterium]|nr:hypothetical protein [Rhodospirillaceae bacterium]